LLAGMALTGCTQSGEINLGHAKNQHPGSATAYVSVELLARDIGLTVISSSKFYAALRDAHTSNFVVIYPEPHGWVFVNGDAVCSSGTIIRDGELLLPADMAMTIRKHLRSERVPPPPLPPPSSVVLAPAPQTVQTLVRTEPPRSPRGVVMIDPGHGGKDPGAKSVLGYWEAPVVLTVGLQVRELLVGSNVTVEMTRSVAETSLDKYGRAALSNRVKPDVYVSIHCDAAANPAAGGYTVYVARGEKGRSLALALAVEHGLRRAGFSRRTADPVAFADFVVLKDNSHPAVLVELGYLTNRAEAARLRDSDHQARYAAAIYEGIMEYLRVHGE